MPLKLFIAILVIISFFGNICADGKDEKFKEILSDILRVLADPKIKNRVYPIKQDIVSNQWMANIFKNVKNDTKNGGNQFVGQFALRNFIQKMHSFAFSHIVDIEVKGANRCRAYDEAALSDGFLKVFSKIKKFKLKLKDFAAKNKFWEFFELIYSFVIKCESILEGVPMEGENQEPKEKKLKSLIEAYNCMARHEKANRRIFSVSIVPYFENTGTEFNGIIIEWNNNNDVGERIKLDNFLTFIEFNQQKLTPRKWLTMARKFAHNVDDENIFVNKDAHNRDLYENMLVQMLEGSRDSHQIVLDYAHNFKAGIFGIGVMQKLLDEGNKNGYLAKFQGIGNEIQRAKNLAEKMFKRKFKECTYEIDNDKIYNFNILEAYLHYEDVIEIDWTDEQKGQMDEIDDLQRMRPYMEYLQSNETNFKIEIAWIGRSYPDLKRPYSELEEYYETDKRGFYGVDLVRMYVEKFGIFAKSVPSRIEREFDLWHLVGKMDKELENLEEWLTKDVFGTELLKEYIQKMEELNEDISEFYENYGIQKIVKNLKENMKKLDDKQKQTAALNAMQKNVQNFAELCKNLPEIKRQMNGIEKLVNNLNREIGKFAKITKEQKGKNEQKMMRDGSQFERLTIKKIEKQKNKVEKGKLAKNSTEKWANSKNENEVNGMENIRKSFEILTKMKEVV